MCGCISTCRTHLRGPSLRSGAQYVDGIRDGRRVFVDGEEVSDVTSHLAFRGAVKSVGALFDIASDPANSELMTFPSPNAGVAVNRAWQLPYSVEDLVARRRAMARWADATFGLMGRTPDHVASFFVGFIAGIDVFARGGDRYAENLRRFFEFMRDHDLYITYTIVPPQVDRSKPAHKQSPPDLYAGVVGQADDGIVIRGAQMIGTGVVLSDYVFLSNIHPLRNGDEDYAISVAVPCNAPGVKIYSRRSYAAAAGSVFDYPLSTRFDETDALVVYDDVFVPWERVFVFRDLAICRDQWFTAPAHLIGNTQSQSRFCSNLRFIVGLAKQLTELIGTDRMPPVQEQIAQLTVYVSMFEGLIAAQEANASKNRNGYMLPGAHEVYAFMNLQYRVYPDVIQILRELCGGGLIQLPSSAMDFSNPEMAADLNKYGRTANHDAVERTKILKLAWDIVGSEFAGRNAQYEMFYPGAPFMVRNYMYRNYDFGPATSLVADALAGYNLDTPQ